MCCALTLLRYKAGLRHFWLFSVLCFCIMLANISQDFTLVCQRYLAGRRLLPSSSPELLKLFMGNPEKRAGPFYPVLNWLELRSLTVLHTDMETNSGEQANNSSADQQQQDNRSVFLIQKNSLSHVFWKAFFLLRYLSQFAFQLDKHICSKLDYLPNKDAGWGTGAWGRIGQCSAWFIYSHQAQINLTKLNLDGIWAVDRPTLKLWLTWCWFSSLSVTWITLRPQWEGIIGEWSQMYLIKSCLSQWGGCGWWNHADLYHQKLLLVLFNLVVRRSPNPVSASHRCEVSVCRFCMQTKSIQF